MASLVLTWDNITKEKEDGFVTDKPYIHMNIYGVIQ